MNLYVIYLYLEVIQWYQVQVAAVSMPKSGYPMLSVLEVLVTVMVNEIVKKIFFDYIFKLKSKMLHILDKSIIIPLWYITNQLLSDSDQ